MSLYRHNFRLECDASRIDSLADQFTGLPMQPVRGEDSEFQIALFLSGAMVQKANISSIVLQILNSAGTVLFAWTNTGSSINGALTVGSWRRGSDYLTSFVLSAANSLLLAAGTYRIVVSALLNSVPAGSTGTVVFANANFDLQAAPPGTAPGTAPTPAPPSAYTKAESDGRFAPIADSATLAGVVADEGALETWLGYAAGAPIKFVPAAATAGFSAGEQLQARTNINAEICAATVTDSLAAAATHTPTPKVYRRFVITLTGAATFANAATFADWITGQIYEIDIIQDATGGRVLTWGNLYTFPTYAAVDPTPSATSRFFARSDGTNVRVWEVEEVDHPPCELMFHCARNVTVDGSDTITVWNDPVATLTGSTPSPLTRAVTFSTGRSCALLTGAKDLRFTGPHKGSAAAGCTVALAFDSSSSASPQFLAKLPWFGVELGYNVSNGLYIAAIGAASGNRVAIAFTPATNAATVFIGTILPSGVGGGIALLSDGKISYVTGGSVTTPAALTTNYVWSNAGADFWNGKGNQILGWERALSWPEMLAVRRALSREIGI